MKDFVKSKLEKFRVNYTQITGQPFTHFFCPILFRDDNVPFSQAHIINYAFPNSSRSWTVQRSDVDNFYGSNFEADFISIQYKTDNISPSDVLINKTL